MCKRVGRENRIVEDHRFRLVREEAQFQLGPESVGLLGGVMCSELLQPLEGLLAMPQVVVGQGQNVTIDAGQ